MHTYSQQHLDNLNFIKTTIEYLQVLERHILNTREILRKNALTRYHGIMYTQSDCEVKCASCKDTIRTLPAELDFCSKMGTPECTSIKKTTNVRYEMCTTCSDKYKTPSGDQTGSNSTGK